MLAHRLVGDFRDQFGTRWSPDGGSIVYGRNTGLWIVASGGAPRLLVGAGDSGARPEPLLAQWAPDARTAHYKAVDTSGATSLWAIAPTGGEPRELVRLDYRARGSPRPEFATDGKRFYFTASERESDIWRMELPAR